MAANSWACACLCLALGQAPADVLVTNQRSLSIPINIEEKRRAELRELVLYASNDQGRTWQQVATMLPTQTAFTFNAPIDGSYWLRAAVINLQNKQEPDNLYQGPPDQKVVIDTMKPLLKLKAPERQGDDIALGWELQEDNPEWTSFRLEHQAKNGGAAWTPIPATAGLTGQARFRPTVQGPVTIRLSFKDQAGNQAFALAEAPGTIATAAFNSPAPAPARGVPAPAPAFPGATAQLAPAPLVPAPTTTIGTPLNDVALPPPAETPKLPPAPLEPARSLPVTPPPAVSAPWTPNVHSAPSKIVASSQAPAPLPALPPSAAPTARRPLPPLQYVNHPEVTLEYALKRVGPSGIGSVDLWWTKNDGQNWELYAVDPESKSGTIKDGNHKRTIELQDGDGLYGFTLVVKSRAGLGKAPPRAGDVPEIRIELDTSLPKVDLLEPRPDPKKGNTLLLEWAAVDNNLTANPIQLEWSPKREGPWAAIAPPLPNTGKHAWSLPDGLPVHVYLRIRARDQAGNESVAVTRDPQLVDLSEPEGTLLNVSVSPR
jgi:hypothetical protein